MSAKNIFLYHCELPNRCEISSDLGDEPRHFVHRCRWSAGLTPQTGTPFWPSSGNVPGTGTPPELAPWRALAQDDASAGEVPVPGTLPELGQNGVPVSGVKPALHRHLCTKWRGSSTRSLEISHQTVLTLGILFGRRHDTPSCY